MDVGGQIKPNGQNWTDVTGQMEPNIGQKLTNKTITMRTLQSNPHSRALQQWHVENKIDFYF
jgi:hypothetical protein